MSTNEPESDPFNYVDVSDFKTTDIHPPDYVLEHALVEHDRRPDEYGVTPIDTESGILTAWIAIEADDMIDLEEAR